MKTIRYKNKWPWGVEVLHIASDGLATVAVCKEPDYDFGFIYNLVVHKMARQQGRGQRLLKLAEWEIKHIFRRNFAVLRVVPGTWMEKWYKRNGYKQWHDTITPDGYIELRKELK